MEASPLTIGAPAKVNLTLEVVGRRKDGFHDIASVFQTVDLVDTLTFHFGESLECNVSQLGGEENLVLKAARLLKDSAGCEEGARIELTKVIPVSAGLGGGSSDAAAALSGLNRWWRLGLSRSQMLAVATQVGADVSFFLFGGTALVEGLGERVSPLPSLVETWLVLLHPPLILPHKTARLYSLLTGKDFSSRERAHRLAERLRQGGGLESTLLGNVFEPVALRAFPGLVDYWRILEGAGGESVHLSGTGPTLFTVVPNQAQGEAIYHRLRDGGQDAYLVRTISSGVWL
ncbi:MAG: 4-(cytidine 5'-diphospho)-2-C-methyl-D-erythritol kinase [Chloroflexi bacterium]|nr:4-(cytidine 5'-diphospho)-2-C-methyl-D-erythritol kinase [Chloroflexota bacterium]